MTKTLVGTPDPEEPDQYFPSTGNDTVVTNTAPTASSSTATFYINAYYNMMPSSTNG